MSIGSTIKQYRKSAKLTQEQLAIKANMSRSYVADIERDRYNPSVETLKAIAAALEIDPAQLLGSEFNFNKSYHSLNDKDERDIAKDLERIMDNLESDNALSFYGEELELDQEAKEILKASIEQSMRLAKQASKKKFTPKKYR